MNLRRQLLLVSLLLLSLPWAGCEFIREMEGALRKGQEQSLQATAQAIAAVMSEQEQLVYANTARRNAPLDQRQSIFAFPTRQPVIIDGYGDGWEAIEGVHFGGNQTSDLSVTCFAQTRNNHLYLLLKVKDEEVVYHNPGLSAEPNGDRLVLRLWQGGKRHDYIIATAAPGKVRARPGNRRQRNIDPGKIRGNWQDAIGGYTLELEIPLIYTGGRLGFYLINEDFRQTTTTETVGNISALDTAAPPWLIYSPPEVDALLAPFRSSGNHIQVVDKDSWLIANLAAVDATAEATTDTFWLVQLLYRNILSQQALTALPSPAMPGQLRGDEITGALNGVTTNQRYRDPDYMTRTSQSAAAPITDELGVLGAVIVRQSGETYLSLTDKAFGSLLGYSLLALGIGVMGLLGYASLLSWRIRALSRAAHNAIGEDGQVTAAFPRSNATDEVGELSRQYANLLNRVREYNDYLRTLSRKLSHELRTPIAVIQTSLDNLEQADTQSTGTGIYLQRAREGLARLQGILTSMSEASRLEESIRSNPLEQVDLVPLLSGVFEAYGAVYPQHHLVMNIQANSARVMGVPDLIVQALDKLIDNAGSFCPPGGKIMLQLDSEPDYWVIRLSNDGPCLPDELQDRLFEPMVSFREEHAGDVHLGLGLHIVRLIAEFHQGHIEAANLADNSGVAMTLRLPRINQTAS